MTENTNSTSADRIIVAGDVMLDHYWKGSADRLSPEAPVPVVHVREQEPRLGGASNVALNIARLGRRATLCGIVGSDHAGGIIRQIAESAGIEPALVTGHVRTTEKIRVLAQNQQIVRVDFEELPTNGTVEVFDDRVRQAFNGAKAIIYSDYNKGALRDVRELIADANAQGLITLVDPKGSNYDKYTGATVITPNRSELAAVVGRWCTESELINKAMALRERLQLDKLLLTRSEEGMTLFEDGKVTNFSTEAREVFDVSGAGDTAIAVLAAMLSRGVDWHEAVRTANRAAGIVVGRLGTSAVTAADLELPE